MTNDRTRRTPIPKYKNKPFDFCLVPCCGFWLIFMSSLGIIYTWMYGAWWNSLCRCAQCLFRQNSKRNHSFELLYSKQKLCKRLARNDYSRNSNQLFWKSKIYWKQTNDNALTSTMSTCYCALKNDISAIQRKIKRNSGFRIVLKIY